MPVLEHVATPGLKQRVRSSVQPPILWATHLDLSFSSLFVLLPWQMPEQHLLSVPRQCSPTSRHPNALFFRFLDFFAFFAAAGRAPRAPSRPTMAVATAWRR